MTTAKVTGRKYGLPGSGKNGLAPGVSIVNGQFLYNGQPLTQTQWNDLNAGGFIPDAPITQAPPGTYDPSLDAQAENAKLGFLFNGQDFTTQSNRLGEDYQTALGRLGQNHGSTLADLLTGYQRNTGDLNTQLGYANQDYGTATANLGRQYQNLGINQAGAIRSAGAGEGGALAQALAKRTANQGIDQSGLDTQHNRQVAGINTDLSRLNQDYNTGVSRENTNYGNQTYDLGLNNQRAGGDLLTNYQRAGVANDAFQRQINGLEVFQAQQAGMLPDQRDQIAVTGPNAGLTYREEVHNGVLYHRYSNGKNVAIRRIK